MGSMVNNRVSKQMKKMKLSIVLAIMAVGLFTFTTSCNKEALDEFLSTCSCSYRVNSNSPTQTEVVNLDDLSAEVGYDITSCSQLEGILDNEWYYVDCL